MKNINDMQTIRELLEEFAKEYSEEDIEYIFIGSDSKSLDLDADDMYSWVDNWTGMVLMESDFLSYSIGKPYIDRWGDTITPITIIANVSSSDIMTCEEWEERLQDEYNSQYHWYMDNDTGAWIQGAYIGEDW
jgi:hypothetical protein